MKRLSWILSFSAVASMVLSNTASAYSVKTVQGWYETPEEEELRFMSDEEALEENMAEEEMDPIIHSTLYESPVFKDGQAISRADFVRAIIASKFPDGIPQGCFERLSPSRYQLLFVDVPKDAAYGPHLCAAMVMGFIDGYSDGTFRPNAPINIAEASKILAKAYRLATDPSDPKVIWYAPYVAALSIHGALPARIGMGAALTPTTMDYMLDRLRKI